MLLVNPFTAQILNANPKGCNQYSGPECAARTATAKALKAERAMQIGVSRSLTSGFPLSYRQAKARGVPGKLSWHAMKAGAAREIAMDILPYAATQAEYATSRSGQWDRVAGLHRDAELAHGSLLIPPGFSAEDLMSEEGRLIAADYWDEHGKSDIAEVLRQPAGSFHLTNLARRLAARSGQQS